jgi:hypothetical protein
MDNRNEIDSAPHAIQRMVEVSIRAAESLLGDGDDTDFFQMPSADANLLDSSLFDIEKRVKAARAMLFHGDKPEPVKPVLSIVRDQV